MQVDSTHAPPRRPHPTGIPNIFHRGRQLVVVVVVLIVKVVVVVVVAVVVLFVVVVFKYHNAPHIANVPADPCC